jgi:tRNA pseudouridine55 synthase
LNPCGFVFLNKEAGKTTFRSLSPLKQNVKKIAKAKVGHAGTLDSEATGLIIAAVGSATRLLSYIEVQNKEYEFKLHLGFSTITGEASGELIEEKDARHITVKDVDAVLHKFRGQISQTPPLYSAVKIDGKRASDRALAGESPVLKSRKIEVISLEWKNKDEFLLKCHCSKGTYIRSLGRDIGKALGVPACVSGIHRTRIGDISLEKSQKWDSEDFSIVEPGRLLKFPNVEVLAEDYAHIQNGRHCKADVVKEQEYLVIYNGKTVALAFGKEDGLLQPKIVFQ